MFTETELEYLGTQRLGRLATIQPDGTVQNNPVGFRYNPDTATIDIGGFNMAASRKYRNVEGGGRVAFVVDDLASVDPWRVRGVEIRGRAEAVAGERPIIRIHPDRILAWGIEPNGTLNARDVDRSASRA